MIYAGIDYSINCPSVCIYDEEQGKLSHSTSIYFVNQAKLSNKEQERRKQLNIPNIHFCTQYEWLNNYSRYYSLADWVLSILLQYGVEVVCLEDYAFAAIGLGWNIAEATSLLRSLIMLTNMHLYTFPPATVKKTFSGKGNALKQYMHLHYKLRYKVEINKLIEKEGFDSPISDIVDSHAMIYQYFHGTNIEKYKLF